LLHGAELINGQGVSMPALPPRFVASLSACSG